MTRSDVEKVREVVQKYMNHCGIASTGTAPPGVRAAWREEYNAAIDAMNVVEKMLCEAKDEGD